MPGKARCSDSVGRLATPYREVLSTPGAPRLAVASLVSKWPISMFPVSTVLLVSPRYSYAEAGATVGAMLLANALSSPGRGRLVARYGTGAVLRTCLAGYLLGLTGIGLCAVERLPFPVVLTAALVMGGFFPPASILLRVHWTALDRVRARGSANALESALMDLALITGPVLATWVSTAGGAVLPFAVVGALMSVAVALLIRFPGKNGEPSAGEGPGTTSRAAQRIAALRSRPLRMLICGHFLFCTALAGTEVALPVYAQQHEVHGQSGWYLAGLSVGSMVGSLLAGRLPGYGPTRLSGLLGAFAVGSSALGLVMLVGPVAVLAACPLAGLAVGSVFARLFTVIGTLTPPGGDHEVQGWANAVTTIGFAAGSSGAAALTGALGAPSILLWSPPAALLAAVCAIPATRRVADSRR